MEKAITLVELFISLLMGTHPGMIRPGLLQVHPSAARPSSLKTRPELLFASLQKGSGTPLASILDPMQHAIPAYPA